MSLSPGVEPEPNLLLPEKFAETPSMKLNPLNENIFPPKAMSFTTCMLDAVIPALALITLLAVMAPETYKKSPTIKSPVIVTSSGSPT